MARCSAAGHGYAEPHGATGIPTEGITSEFDKLKDEAAKLAQEHPEQVKQGEQVGGEGWNEAGRDEFGGQGGDQGGKDAEGGGSGQSGKQGQ